MPFLIMLDGKQVDTAGTLEEAKARGITFLDDGDEIKIKEIPRDDRPIKTWKYNRRLAEWFER